MQATTTKTQANITLVQEAFGNFGKGDIPAIIAVCTEDVSWGSWENDTVPFAQNYQGKEGAMQFFTHLADHLDYKRFEPRDFFAAGEKVFAKVYHEAEVKSTGKSFAHDSLLEFTIRDEKISYFFAYVDTHDQARAFAK
ncbi:MAG: nuclear transport factor 2 family protein [Chitinophagaceae bacterium]|nr:nuclear transport factor 2 family protein [Chitinophagaceae bacterium]